ADVGQFTFGSATVAHLRLREAAAHPRTRRLRWTPLDHFFLERFALRASFFCTPAGWSMKRKRIPSTIALYFTAPVERPSSLAASRADIFAFASARIFFRSAGVHGALCLRADLAIGRILVNIDGGSLSVVSRKRPSVPRVCGAAPGGASGTPTGSHHRPQSAP